jgi:hypothetical protein
MSDNADLIAGKPDPWGQWERAVREAMDKQAATIERLTAERDAARADERERCAAQLDEAAIKLFGGRARVPQVDRHVAEVLRRHAAAIRASEGQ